MIDMKNYIRILTMITALMFGAANGAWAQLNVSDIVIEKKPNASAGNIEPSVTGREVTLTVTPATGYYIKASDIVAEKLVDPGKANAPKRRTSEITDVIPGKMYNSEKTKEISSVEAGSTAKYVFTVPAGYDGAYVTATFTSLTEGGIRITSSTTSVTYSSNGHYILVDDIDASVLANLYSDEAFTGTFDGNGFTITGLTHPLFKTVNGGVVKNVMLKNVHINQSGNVGAITGEASGYTRIYNCGILPNDNTFSNRVRHSSVASTDGYCGGLVGWLKDDSRVINCFSFANVNGGTTVAGIVGYNNFASTAKVTGGKYTELKTAVVNCMFYGNITGGTNRYPVYGGELITNAAATGISSYNYYRSGSTFNTSNGEPTAYNCSFPAEERYLTQVEFHRSLLNSNRELCGWWVGSDVAPSTLTTTQVQAIPKDASLMYKWVVDPSIAPYPILKPFGKYASVINGNTGTPWVNRATANPYEGKQLGTLTVNVNSGSHSSAASRTLSIPITDMDTLHYDFGYRKIQLPYYNTVFGNPEADTWTEKYANNYTDQVVTGWKITAVTGGTPGTFDNSSERAWENGYNFADRKCTNKDLYSVSERVFAQGGNYYVPDGVTAITIEAYWGKAIYVRNNGGYYDRVNITKASTGSPFAPAGTRDNNVNGATIQTTSIKETLTAANIDAKKTVYDYALVLVGNVQESVGKNDVKHKTEDTRGFTIMSVDLDFDEEPDYCLEWQLGDNMARQIIAPIRFDFLPVVELGIAGKLDNSTNFFSLGCYRSKGHFEVTETSFIRFGQFEFELGDRDEGPIILNGGIYDQYCRGRNGETNQHINYVILGGHIVMPSFTPGAHVNSNAKFQTRHCAVNALGGDFTSFYLTGGYNEAIVPYEDNPHCYIDGGRFGTIAAAYKEGIAGDVTWRINHALIGEFYGGGVMAQKDGTTYKIVKGSIDVVIDNSIVGKYCGGPKFGDMMPEKTVKTSATGTTFNQFFGAGNGGTNYVQYKNTDATGDPISDWSSTINSNYTVGKYRSKAQGYEANYDIEVINYSTGDGNGKFVNRSYYYSAQFATTNTGNVTSTLTDCTINTNFYGGGFLGGVTGNVTSTLNNCTVKGAVFGAGYSASAGTVNIYNKDKVPPVPNTYTGMIKPQTGGTSTTYYWTHDKGSTSSPITAATETDPKNYFYTEIPLTNLGAVTGNVTLTINGNTVADEDGKVMKVGESVYGGGEESVVNGNTTVAVTGGTIGTTGKGGARWGNVFGGGKGKEDDVNAGLVKSNTNISISGSPTIIHNIYGGGAYGSVGNFTYDESGMPTACAENTGNTQVTITGGTFGTDGHNNGMVFGSSRGDVAVPEGEPAESAVDPNDRMAWVNSTRVIIGTQSDESNLETPKIAGSVYGSGENGHTFKDAQVDIHSGRIGLTADMPTDPEDQKGAKYPYRGNVYGGGCGTDMYWIDANGNDVKDPGEEHYNAIAGIVRGNATTTIDGGHVVHNVYGAGAMGSVGNEADAESGKTTITITGKAQIGVDGDSNGNVYGAARGDQSVNEESYATVRTTKLEVSGKADIKGSVFGGGSLGLVKESTVIDIKGGSVHQSVYGGGSEANVKGNTTVTMTDGYIFNGIFGGGLSGSVGTFTRSTAEADVNIFGHTAHEGCIGKPTSCADGTGKCTIVVSGGQIGPIEVATQGMSRLAADGGPVPEGWVWGAGRGIVEDPTTHPDTHFTAYVNETDVTIKDNAFVLESIIGGGEFGRVLGDTNVKIEGGQIGVGYNQTDGDKPKRYDDEKFVDPSVTQITEDNALVACSHYPYGKTVEGKTVYDTFDPYADEYLKNHASLPTGLEGGVTDGASDGKTWIGCVYGGGSGYFPYKTTDADGNITDYGWVESAGWVEGNANLTISGGHILSNVYGANEYTTVQGKSTVTMTGGTIGVPRTQAQIAADPKIGHLFGGGKGDPRPYFKNKTNAGSVEVDVSGGIIYGSVFGGGESGTVKGGVTVKMTGGVVLSDVYGGGALADTQTDNWDETKNSNAGDWADGKTSAINTTLVRLTGGNILGEAYGGGLGETGSPAYVYGDVLLDLNGTTTSGETGTTIGEDKKGCTVNQVFGCNNAAGSPMGEVLVHVYATQNKDKADISTKAAKNTNTFDVVAVYGGGNLAAYEPAGGKKTTNSTNVIIDGCGLSSIQTVYGGGNAASTPATNVTVNGTYEILELFGGGNGLDNLPDGRPNPGANVGYKNYTVYTKDDGGNWVASDDPNYDTKEERTASTSGITYGTGRASINVFGGLVHRVFGGSNTKGNVRQTALTLLDENNNCPFCVDEAYGGGKSAEMDAEAKLLMACIPGLQAAYGGAEAADVRGNVTLNITNGTFDRVFGGNNLSGTISGSITVNVEEVSCRPIIIGELYGGGNQAAYSVYGYKNIGTEEVPVYEVRTSNTDGTAVSIPTDPYSDTQYYADPQVNVISFTSIGNIYGGGYGSEAKMVGNPTVNVNEVVGTPETYPETGDFDSNGYKGKDMTIDGHLVTLPAHTKTKIGAIGNVFGGGNAAQVIGNTTVNIGTLEEVYVVKEFEEGASVTGYYTRKNDGTYIDASGTAKDGTTYYEKKDVIGVDIRGNVYGGGNNAEVTGNTNVNIGKYRE